MFDFARKKNAFNVFTFIPEYTKLVSSFGGIYEML